MFRSVLFVGLAALSITSLPAQAAVDDWHFEWPSETYQCQTIAVSITGGVPPWSLQIVPIGKQPIYWNVRTPTGPFNSSYPARAEVPLELEAGTPYVVIVSDSEGYNEAPNNPSAIQVVQPSNDSSCLAAASPAKKNFEFQVYGSVTQCDRSFGVTWTTTVGTAPYGCTVVPLDTSYNPWDVQFTEEGSLDSSAIWRVNMTSGTRFTVIMHDGYGLGRGGVGEIYEVASSKDLTCVTQRFSGKAQWPAGLQVNQVPSTTTAWGSAPTDTSTSNNTSSDVNVASASPSASSESADGGGGSSSGGSSLGTGAIAGIAAGGAVLILFLLALLFFLRRKRRQNRLAGERDVDLIGGSGGGTGHVEPKVEPYRAVGDRTPVPTMGYGQNRTEGGYGEGQLVQTDPNYGIHGVDTPGSGPTSSYGNTFFGAAAASGVGSGNGSRPNSQHFNSGQDKTEMFRGYELAPAPASSTSASSPGQANTSSGYYGPGSRASGMSSPEKEGYAPGLFGPASSTASPSPAIASPGAMPPTEYRRHTDGGEVPEQHPGEHGGVVDLPPLYTDVPARRGQGQGQQQ